MPYQTCHMFYVAGMGFVGLYVPANWDATDWAMMVFNKEKDSDVIRVPLWN